MLAGKYVTFEKNDLVLQSTVIFSPNVPVDSFAALRQRKHRPTEPSAGTAGGPPGGRSSPRSSRREFLGEKRRTLPQMLLSFVPVSCNIQWVHMYKLFVFLLFIPVRCLPAYVCSGGRVKTCEAYCLYILLLSHNPNYELYLLTNCNIAVAI